MYIRKTVDQWDTQGNYGCGWETVTCDDNRKDAIEMIKCYRENEPQTQFRLKKYRVARNKA